MYKGPMDKDNEGDWVWDGSGQGRREQWGKNGNNSNWTIKIKKIYII